MVELLLLLLSLSKTKSTGTGDPLVESEAVVFGSSKTSTRIRPGMMRRYCPLVMGPE